MPQITGSLQPEGALADVLIGLNQTEVQKLRNALQAVPPSKRLRALIDSGAEMTCLDPSIVQALSLVWKTASLTNMPSITGVTYSSFYQADVTILHPSGKRRQHFMVKDWVVCELPLGVLGYDVVIGRDILDLMRFTYDGFAQEYMLEWK
jgi:Retroviral aspartyl protease